MPIYDFECGECGYEFDSIEKSSVKIIDCPECGKKAKKVFPKKAPKFDLLYDPQKDTVDWDGNRSRYYDDYKAAKARGENVRIAQLDGDG